MGEEGEHDMAASDEWTADPPKKLVLLGSKSEVMNKAQKLREAMDESGEEKALPGLISASGANEAKVHLKAFVPVEQPDAATLEMARVRVADARRATTEVLEAGGKAVETGERPKAKGGLNPKALGLGLLGLLGLGIGVWRVWFAPRLLYLEPLNLPVPVVIVAPVQTSAVAESPKLVPTTIDSATQSTSGPISSTPIRKAPKKKTPSEMVQ